MALIDDVSAALPDMQRQAESLMTLTLTPYAPTGDFTTDADGFEVPELLPQTPHAGKVQGGSQSGKDTQTRYIRVGDVERPVLEGGLHIPLSAPVPQPGQQINLGWQYVVTGVNGLADVALLGRRFLVVEVPAKSFATARRLNVISLD
ncbi:MAG: hypothetical protein JWP74_1760 [Marmoricola sp.]|nr:hypothetical protein [Marmoricola sp.]